MRTSLDIYKKNNGELVAISCGCNPPENSTLYTGYNYKEQKWYFKGIPDTRTLAELKKSVENFKENLRNNN